MNTPAHLLLMAVILLTNCKNGDSRQGSNQQVAVTDTVPLFPETGQGQKLRKHVYTMSGYGENAENIYQQSLNELRQDSSIYFTIQETYRKMPEREYLLRTLLIETMKELGVHASLPFLFQLANSAIPEEKSRDKEVSTRENEIVIRVTAVEGISKLALDKDTAAQNRLKDLVANEDLTIRQMSIRGYLQSLPPELVPREIDRLRATLPASQHWMITTKATEIRSAPHPAMPDSFPLKEEKRPDNPSPRIKQ